MSCACSSPATPPEDTPQVASTTEATCGSGMSIAEYQAYVTGSNSCPAICGPTADAACVDPNLLSANSSTGKDLDTTWTNAVNADSMTLLGRSAKKLAKLKGTGWLWNENGWTFVRSFVPLSIKRLWAKWIKPTPSSMAIPGDPEPINFLAGVDSTETPFAIPGQKDTDSIMIWNHTTRMWETKSTTAFPLCHEGPLESAEELEILGLVKQNPENADYETEVRCVKKLCGTGIVVMDEVLAPGDCSDCNGPADCGSTTAHLLPYPPIDEENPDRIWAFKYTLEDGLRWVQVIQGSVGINGRDGVDGRDGRDGRDGIDGGGGGGFGSATINYEALAAALDYSKMPQGPAGVDGIDGQSIQGPIGLPGKDGKDGANGVDGVDGINGTNGSSGSIVSTPTADELAAIYTLVQLQEYLGTPVLLNSATRDTTGASQTNVYSYLVSAGGSIADPVDSVAGKLSTVDGVLLRLDVLSSDPQDVEAGASATHSIEVAVNGRQSVYLISENAAANAADAGGLLPNVEQLSTSSQCVVPYGPTLSVVRTSTKWPTLPAASQITKYNAGLNTVRVYVMGFLVTRKVNPAIAIVSSP